MRIWVAWFGCALALWGQGMATSNRRAEARRPLPAGKVAPAVEYRDVAVAAGLTAVNISASAQAKNYIVETTGNGVALIDYDGDGLLDVLLLDAGESVEDVKPRTQHLYRNKGGLQFENVSAKSGIPALEWAQGACAGDFDGDGRVDLVITQWGQNVLLRNEGGRFADESAKRLPAEGKRWSTGCAFLDYDRDGDLDLFVAHYVQFDARKIARPRDKNHCSWKNMAVVCGPRGLPGESMSLYRNDGGRFVDVSKAAGIETPKNYYGFTVLTGDFDNDGWVDVYVACDSVASLFFRNLRNGKFEEVGIVSGAALNEDGREQAGMGATAGDYDGDGRLDIFKTNFSDDTPTLYRNMGGFVFQDVTAPAGLAINTKLLGWGAAFVDADQDGWKDLFYVNGHVYPEVDAAKLGETFRQERAFYWNRGDRQFHEMSAAAGGAVTERHASRGLAVGDLDNDGSLEIVIMNLHEGPSLLKNFAAKGNWLMVEAEIGAQVRVTAGGRTQLEEIRSGGFHISQGDFRAHFGLGKETKARVVVRWANGTETDLGEVTAGQVVKARPGGGLGASVYEKRCAACHDQVSPRTPPRGALERMTAARIVRSMDFGTMMAMAYALTRTEREAVAGYLSKVKSDPGSESRARCASGAIGKPLEGTWIGWSASEGNTRYQAASGLSVEQVKSLKLKWAFGFEGDVSAFGAPTVVDGRLYTGSAAGTVYALEATSGCVHWTFAAQGPVRTPVRAVRQAQGHVLLFGDQNGMFYAVDSREGKLLWKRRVEEHESTRLTGGAVERDGVVFIPVASWEETRATKPDYECCTFRGSVVALRVKDGSLVWKTYLVDTPKRTGVSRVGTAQWGPSGAGVWSAPTLDPKRGLLYVTTGDNYSMPATGTSDAVVALDLRSGAVKWVKQTTANDVFTADCGLKGPNCPPDAGPDFDYGAPAMMVTEDLLVAGQKSGMVYGFDLNEAGKIVWQARVGKGGVVGGVQWGMASDGRYVYAATSDLLRKRQPPVNGVSYHRFDLDPAEGGGLSALRVGDGGVAWHRAAKPCAAGKAGCSPAQSAAVTATAGVVWSGSMDGHLRAYSSETGEVLWEVDTARVFETVNGVSANGGSMDGAGPVVAGGMVFVNSGYARFGGMPGNVLLAFGVE